MPIRSRQNLYQGVNAHLHSYLHQEPGGWEVFHGMHITHLAEAIDAILPPGYLVDPEKSMQIRQLHPDTGEVINDTWRPRLDIIYEHQTPASEISDFHTATPTLTLPATASLDLDEQSYFRALVIREVTEQGELGKPVTWIELFSPTNKPPHTGYRQYHEKRNATIQSGLALVEIDYLHETRPPIQRLPSYINGDTDAFPYMLVVTNSRPRLEEGVMQIYGFYVDQPIPIIAIPLAGSDYITLDMNVVYNRTYTSLSSFNVRVDYEQLPQNVETYYPDDQQRIRARMQAAVQ